MKEKESAEETSSLCVKIFREMGAEVTIQQQGKRMVAQNQLFANSLDDCVLSLTIYAQLTLALLKVLTYLTSGSLITLPHECNRFSMKPRGLKRSISTSFVGLKTPAFTLG